MFGGLEHFYMAMKNILSNMHLESLYTYQTWMNWEKIIRIALVAFGLEAGSVWTPILHAE